MSAKGLQTRTRILDAAQDMILDYSYSGMSLDELIGQLGLTKGAFFHHFDSKSDLAKTLIRRFSDEGSATLTEMLARSQKLSDDPLQQLLILVGLYIEEFEGLTEPYPGCLLAAYVYEMQQFDDEVREVINSEFLTWRKILSAQIERIKLRYPPREAVDTEALADMFISTFEGAFIMSKSLRDPAITAEQLKLYRTFITALFNNR
jgi:TetR/AcrR family transcriptional repressor of nem operon